MEVFCSTEACQNEPFDHAGLCRECLLRLAEEREVTAEHDDVPRFKHEERQVFSAVLCKCGYVALVQRLSEFPFPCPKCGKEIEAQF